MSVYGIVQCIKPSIVSYIGCVAEHSQNANKSQKKCSFVVGVFTWL